MKYIICGGNKLSGEVRIQSAKNSVLALMSASVLARGDVYIRNCPYIYDVFCMAKILKKMGAKVRFDNGGLLINTDLMNSFCLPEKLTKDVRASVFLIGALLSRFNMACMTKPGGCNIGARPIDIHIESLQKMGASFVEEYGLMRFSTDGLKNAQIRLKYPSVGATENIMMAASMTSGVTTIENCAREPEIVDLQNFLNLMGAKIIGAGTSFIRIEGQKCLRGVEYTPISDRIETGTFLLAALSCGGEIGLKGAKPQNISQIVKKLHDNACKIYLNNDNIYIRVNNKIKGFEEIVTSPYPGFPTDLQPIVVSCACSSSIGAKSIVKETVFESRFKYVDELKKLGANINVFADNRIEVYGSQLRGAKLVAPDLRGGAALCIAAMSAEGVSEISQINNVERGYENFDQKLRQLGANVQKK